MLFNFIHKFIHGCVKGTKLTAFYRKSINELQFLLHFTYVVSFAFQNILQWNTLALGILVVFVYDFLLNNFHHYYNLLI